MDAYPGPRTPAGSITIEREGADRQVLCLRGDVDTAVATGFTLSQGRDLRLAGIDSLFPRPEADKGPPPPAGSAATGDDDGGLPSGMLSVS
jgi:hypothetical protein